MSIAVDFPFESFCERSLDVAAMASAEARRAFDKLMATGTMWVECVTGIISHQIRRAKTCVPDLCSGFGTQRTNIRYTK